MGRRQKGRSPHRPKGKRRPKHWHRRDEIDRWDAADLPDVGSGADPTAGTPRPPRRVAGRNRGDTL
jgi:hypothetical protein